MDKEESHLKTHPKKQAENHLSANGAHILTKTLQSVNPSMDYQNSALPYLLALDAFPKFGPVRLRKLHQAFGEPHQAWRAGLQELIAAGIENKIAQEFLAWRPNHSPEKKLAELIEQEIGVIFFFEDDYPSKLKDIFDPPFLLYYRGQIPRRQPALSIVGSRHYSRYGQEAASMLSKNLASAGLTIVSGLALGIDAIAHRAVLDVQGLTWAVLGSGLDKPSIYPAANRQLADQIISTGGCLLSEFSPGSQGLPYHFPMRNRIIAGLSFGTLVIEAALKSGSLITAQLALDYGREVMALPGPINSPLSQGTNLLLKQGARPITEAADILELLDLKALTSYSNKNPQYEPQNQTERLLLSLLSFEPLHIDELARLSGQKIANLQSQLLFLEIKGAVKNTGNMEYIKLNITT
jgi:DNA processing protein